MTVRVFIEKLEHFLDARDATPPERRGDYDYCTNTRKGREYQDAKDALEKELDWILRDGD